MSELGHRELAGGGGSPADSKNKASPGAKLVALLIIVACA